MTRPTPQKKILPILLNEINYYRIKDTMITLIIALGTHRPMTKKEIFKRFGKDVVNRIKIINHDYKEKSCINLGTTEQGTPIKGGICENLLDLAGNAENFVRKEVEMIVARVGLDFIINTINDIDGNLVKVFAGNFISAYRRGVGVAEKIYRPLINERVDIVIVNACPTNVCVNLLGVGLPKIRIIFSPKKYSQSIDTDVLDTKGE